MSATDKLLSAVAVALLLAGITYLTVPQLLHDRGFSIHHGPDEEGPIAAGGKAAPFELKDLGGKTVTLESLRGKVIFLNVWATWCGPCREEMPSMETLYNDFRGRKDFVILAVSQDTKGKAAVEPYVEKNGYHFEVLLDPDNKIGELYNVSGVPETFIIDRNGRIVAHHMGAFDWSRPDVRGALEDLLDAKGA